MARSNPAAKSWGVFVRSRLAALKLNQAEFRRRMEAVGFDISKQTASQWANGDNAPDANTALAVAPVLESPDTEALRAAGYGPVADRMEKRAAEGEGLAPVSPVDPIIEEIMAMAHLGLKVRQALVDQYLEERAAAERKARALAQAWADNGDSDGSAA